MDHWEVHSDTTSKSRALKDIFTSSTLSEKQRSGIKISPFAKADYRSNLLKKCLLRVKMDRESHFEKLRGRHLEDYATYAEDIVTSAIGTFPRSEDDLTREDKDSDEFMEVMVGNNSSIEGTVSIESNVDFYIEVMEQVQKELQLEYAEYMAEQSIEPEEECDETFLCENHNSEDMLLCPFCL